MAMAWAAECELPSGHSIGWREAPDRGHLPI